MKCVTSHYSQRSIDEFPDSMRTMFPDSGIVRDFTLGRIKIEYIKNHGLKRYYQNKFMSAVKMLIVVWLVSINHGTTYLIRSKWMFSCSILILLKIEWLYNPVWQVLNNERLDHLIHDHFSSFLNDIF